MRAAWWVACDDANAWFVSKWCCSRVRCFCWLLSSSLEFLNWMFCGRAHCFFNHQVWFRCWMYFARLIIWGDSFAIVVFVVCFVACVSLTLCSSKLSHTREVIQLATRFSPSIVCTHWPKVWGPSCLFGRELVWSNLVKCLLRYRHSGAGPQRHRIIRAEWPVWFWIEFHCSTTHVIHSGEGYSVQRRADVSCSRPWLYVCSPRRTSLPCNSKDCNGACTKWRPEKDWKNSKHKPVTLQPCILLEAQERMPETMQTFIVLAQNAQMILHKVWRKHNVEMRWQDLYVGSLPEEDCKNDASFMRIMKASQQRGIPVLYWEVCIGCTPLPSTQAIVLWVASEAPTSLYYSHASSKGTSDDYPNSRPMSGFELGQVQGLSKA